MTVRRAGLVTKRTVAPGSKSERAAVVLETDDGHYVLRRTGGNPFRDSVVEQLVGKKVVADGILHGGDFIMSDWSEVADSE